MPPMSLSPSNPNAQRDDLMRQQIVAMNALTAAIKSALPLVQSVAGSASAGGAALPSVPAGFLVVTNPATGLPVKVAFYNG